jgi:hypothetical protein
MAVEVGDIITADLLNNLTPEPIATAFDATTPAAITTTTETVNLTVASTTYLANKAYRIVLEGGYTINATSGGIYVRVRKTNTAGQVIGDFERWVPGNAAFVAGAAGYNTSKVFTVGAADVTAVLVYTYAPLVASSVTAIGNAQAPRRIDIVPCGASTAYASAPVLV